jgi:hypothetical protein
MKKSFRGVTLPPEAKSAKPYKAEHYNQLIKFASKLAEVVDAQKLNPGSSIGVKSGPAGTTLFLKRRTAGEGGVGYRFGFGGLFKDAEGVWRVRIEPGCVIYNEIKREGVFDDQDDKSKAIFLRGVFPTIEVGGEDVRIDDESRPALELGERSNATVWLVVSTTKCASSLDTERLEITDRDVESEDAVNGETWVKIVDFDVEVTGEGATQTRKATEIFTFLHDNWEQPYTCEDAEGDSSMNSFDSEWPFSSDESGSSDGSMMSDSSGMGGGSDGSGSSDDEGGDGADCQVRMTGVWTNRADCFPVDTSIFGPEFCMPKKYRFQIDCQYWFKNNFGGVQCQAIAYAVSTPGGLTVNGASTDTATEYRWKNDARRTLTFEFDNPPICEFLTLNWRVKTFAAVLGFGGVTPEDQGCCGQTFEGSAKLQFSTASDGTVSIRKLPPVCGPSCLCSSSLGSSGSSSAP